MQNSKALEWSLRIGVAGEFAGHAVFALQLKQSWIPYFTAIGLSPEMALQLMPIIGVADLALAALILVKPMRFFVLWMAFWGFATALARPIAGDPIWDFVERWANWAAPLALLYYYGWPKNAKEWFSNK